MIAVYGNVLKDTGAEVTVSFTYHEVKVWPENVEEICQFKPAVCRYALVDNIHLAALVTEKTSSLHIANKTVGDEFLLGVIVGGYFAGFHCRVCAYHAVQIFLLKQEEWNEQYHTGQRRTITIFDDCQLVGTEKPSSH